MKSFTDELKKQADPIWRANFDHPFVQGIANGNLAFESFRYYVLQDSYYLSHFARIQAIGASRASDLFTTSRMAAHSMGTYEAELGLHENFLKQLEVTKQELDEFVPSPTAYAYTSHLYRVAASGSLAEIIAASCRATGFIMKLDNCLRSPRQMSKFIRNGFKHMAVNGSVNW
ncbi:thiaminase II [Mesobacillus boroniphilus JCM 21738]|uniref:Aminopyrimidine aminohydrolase n=1 Tax=Mesobacillus boroniphilus JCM 21738 TaxID=1294265 RepID=W4RU49_9BACI|nr:thiaminase II [Mesobacillus boroniphilus JCM 21738]